MRILMYYDGTHNTMDALPIVKRHAKAFDARVDVVSSLPRGSEDQLDRIESMKEGLAYMKDSLTHEKIPCETHLLIRGNEPGDDVVWFAREHGVDEIILGTEKKSRLEKFIVGSVAQHVAVHVECPVVIV